MAEGAGGGRPAPVYRLHAVLSHVGNAHAGHYVAYVHSRERKRWYKFDDTRVTEVPEDAAVKGQFGGEYGGRGA